MNFRFPFGKTSFSWPRGSVAAVSLTFDDARRSQVDDGIPLLDQYGINGTFYVLPSQVKVRLEGWRKAVAKGHEVGNHSVNHPCSGNFPWAKKNALENYTMEKMRTELIQANDEIEALVGVRPRVFAYPCGQTFVGRGVDTRSYVPLVAELFLTGRGWLDEGPNDPAFCDFAQLTGMQMDGKDFDTIRSLLDTVRKNGQWLVLAGHEVGEKAEQSTSLTMLEKLVHYVRDQAPGIWVAPVGAVAAHIQKQRGHPPRY